MEQQALEEAWLQQLLDRYPVQQNTDASADSYLIAALASYRERYPKRRHVTSYDLAVWLLRPRSVDKKAVRQIADAYNVRCANGHTDPLECQRVLELAIEKSGILVE